MPKKVYNNVVGYRVLDNGMVCEDVTGVTPPTIKNSTTTISVVGLVADVDMPDITHLDAMEMEIAHNNGVNCHLLASPGRHSIETRLARQRYDVPAGEINHEGMKIRAILMHKETNKGKFESGNPYGSTEKFSVLRYEEEINGEIVTLIDAMAGIIRINGKDYTSEVESLLS